MQRMKGEAFFVAYVLCESLKRGPQYIDAMTDPQTYSCRAEDASSCEEQSSGTPDFDYDHAPVQVLL